MVVIVICYLLSLIVVECIHVDLLVLIAHLIIGFFLIVREFGWIFLLLIVHIFALHVVTGVTPAA